MRNLNILIVSSFLFSIISCSGGTNYVGTGNTAQKTVSYEYSADSPTFDVADATTTVNVTGVKGKKLYLAKYNMESTSTPSDSIRVLSSATGLQSAQADLSADLVTNGGNSANEEEHPRSLLWAEKPQNPSWLSSLEDSGINADLTPRTFTDDVEQINPVVGTTTKDLYIPYGNNMGAFFRMTFVARAVGDHCIVWSPAETQSAAAQSDQAGAPSELTFPDKTAGNAVFTDAMANDLKDKFELAYPYETKMFGEKAKKIFSTHNDNDKTQVDIKKISDTAAYTNIVVYDFKNSSNIYGPVGYFTHKDYRPSYKTLYGTDWDFQNLVHEKDFMLYYFSNEGNYIYLTVDDVVFDEKGLAKKAWVEANEASGTIVCYPDCYLTLCHEYMHSLQYGRKIIEHAFSMSDWSVGFSEMLGSLCENVMENVIGVPKNYTIENYRIKNFCNEHYYSSVMDSNQGLSYANLLLFGIYLTRNYGGAKLIGDMVMNDDIGGWSCILKAIKNVTGIEKTEEQLMKEFLEQLLVADSRYTSNKNSAPLVVNGVDFTMPAVNMRDFSEWYGYELATMRPGDKDYEEYQQVKNGVKTYDAKDIIKKKTVAGEGVYDIRPRGGFNLHFIGTADSDTVSIVFSSVASGAKPPKMMIVVGE